VAGRVRRNTASDRKTWSFYYWTEKGLQYLRWKHLTPPFDGNAGPVENQKQCNTSFSKMSGEFLKNTS